MGKLKALIIIAIVLVVSLIIGFFLIQNDHDIVVDLLYQAQSVETSVGRFALGFFSAGLFIGIVLCVFICVLMMLELKVARRETKKLNKQLEKLRERSLKDSG